MTFCFKFSNSNFQQKMYFEDKKNKIDFCLSKPEMRKGGGGVEKKGSYF